MDKHFAANIGKHTVRHMAKTLIILLLSICLGFCLLCLVLLKNMYTYIRKPSIFLLGSSMIALMFIIFKTRAAWKAS